MEYKNFDVWGMRVDVIRPPEVIAAMENWINRKEFGNYVVISNANDAFISRNNIDARESVNNSSLSVPDGISLVWLAKLYGYGLKAKVRGTDLLLEFLRLSEKKGYSNFFYGSTQRTLDLLSRNLKMKFPKLNIAGTYSPPFREASQEEDAKIIEIINKASPDVLWIGLGCPKQQLWMSDHKKSLKVPVMAGVGAAFNFISETKAQAPFWMRNSGLEWLFRLINEPRRLWKRYLIGNALFTGLFLREFVRVKILRNNKSHD